MEETFSDFEKLGLTLPSNWNIFQVNSQPGIKSILFFKLEYKIKEILILNTNSSLLLVFRFVNRKKSFHTERAAHVDKEVLS